MKRIALYIIALVAGITAVSCLREEKAVFDESQAIAPIINSFSLNEDGDVIVNFTPGSMGQSFNEKMPVNHSLVLLQADDKPASRVLTSAVDGNVITVTTKSLSRGLATLGYVDGDIVGKVVLSLRASFQDQARDNGRNGYIESDGRVNLEDVLVVLPQESPYKEYTKLADWTVIGSLPAYEMNWDKDLVMWTDGKNNYVAAHVTLGKDDEFKFRKELAWDENFGGTFSGLDEEFAITEGGDNIKVSEEGIYDIFFNTETKKAWISEAFDPYPAFTESSDWSVIGSLTEYKINWDNDIAMITDGTSHLALGVSLAKEDEFKFRKDKDWTVNLGGKFGGLGTEFSVTQDGDNIQVGEEGSFDLMVNPEAGTAMVSEASGAKVSYVIAPEPEPEPETVTGWNIIGLNGDWDNDIIATQDGDVWTAFITAKPADGEETTSFKWRKDGAWDENYGGTMVALGEPFAAVAGGPDINVPAGFYKVVLDLSDAEAPTITVSAGDVFSLIGNINGTGWDTDFELAEENGVYTSELVYIDGGFKIRHNFSWADDDTYGAETDDFTPEMGAAFKLAQPGKNINLPGGNYRVQFTLATMEAVVTRVDYELPDIDLTQFEYLEAMAGAETWGLIGPAQPGKWDTDTDLQKIQDDPEVWAVMNLPLQGDKFKFRGNDTWGDYDLGGGEFALNEPIVLTKGGGDMTAVLGVYTIYLYPTYGVAYFTEGSGDVPPPPAKPEAWSLVGTIGGTSWGTDFDLDNTSGDKWEIKGVEITDDDEFKIRADHDWGTSVGGPEENSTSTIDPANPYGVYEPVLGEAFAVGDKNIRIGVAGTYNITFDYAAQTILIRDASSVVENMWGVVGTINNWGNDGPDVVMEEDGLFVVARNVALAADDKIKIRFNNEWTNNRGGKSAVGVPVKAVSDGSDITVGVAGEYDVYYRPDCEVLIVNEAGADLNYWGVVGTINNWAAPDVILYLNDDELLESSEIDITADDLIKIRQNEEWTVNRGGSFAAFDEPFAVTQDGSNITVGVEGTIQVIYNAAAETITIKGEGVQPAVEYGDYIYTVGGDTDWSDVYPLRSGQTAGANNGKYKGFGYLSQEFKFKPNADDWTGDWECVGDGQIGQGSNNCPAPATAGYYMIEVDLTEMTYSLTLINSIGIIGPAQAGGWDTDTDMTYDSTTGAWVAKGVALGADEFKFRANDAWAINWGGALDALVQDGGNIAATAGTYDVALYAWCDGMAYATLTAASAPVAVEITIDGDMSDWANVEGLTASSESAAHKEFKVAFDEDYLYFYTKTNNNNGNMWGNGRYMYFNFDLDNDPSTGFTHDSVAGLEAYIYIYMYGGTSSAQAINATPTGKIAIETDSTSSYTCETNACAGVITSEIVETEVKIARSDFGIKKGDTIRINSWGNKSASDLKSEFITVTIDK